jgi:hypothetical protein
MRVRMQRMHEVQARLGIIKCKYMLNKPEHPRKQQTHRQLTDAHSSPSLTLPLVQKATL